VNLFNLYFGDIDFTFHFDYYTEVWRIKLASWYYFILNHIFLTNLLLNFEFDFNFSIKLLKGASTNLVIVKVYCY